MQEPKKEYIKTRSALIVCALVMFVFSQISWAECYDPNFTWRNSLCSYNPPKPDNFVCPPSFPFSYGGGYCVSSYDLNLGGRIYNICNLLCASLNESNTALDSLDCVNRGLNFINGSCQSPCDSTKWTCNTSVETSQTTIANDFVTCINGSCYGGIYCEFKSTSITTCVSECGETTINEASVPIRYDGACNDDNLTDEDICTPTQCTTFEGYYHLFKKCASREVLNGEIQMFPRFVGGGKGSCFSAGLPEASLDSAGFGAGVDSTSISKQCLMYGIGCPAKDSTDYTEKENRNPSKCSCEKYDGLSSISKIVCPDGSSSIFYGSCDSWKDSFSSSSSPESSSNPPESSSSVTEESPASSGGELVGNWVTWSQGEDIKSALGAIILNTQPRPASTINLDDYATTGGQVDVSYSRADSIYDPSTIVDTNGIVEAIFGRITDKNKILDTLTASAPSTCPCITFFEGNAQTSIENGRLTIARMRFDLGNIHGYNLCRIISAVVVALASIVSFFIGFSIFKNISQ